MFSNSFNLKINKEKECQIKGNILINFIFQSLRVNMYCIFFKESLTLS